jgi:hypothetical protein
MSMKNTLFMACVVLWEFADVSEKRIATIFNVQMSAKQAAKMFLQCTVFARTHLNFYSSKISWLILWFFLLFRCHVMNTLTPLR